MGLSRAPWLLLGGNRQPPATLDLNFLSGTLDPSVTFTRASVGTYFDATGTLQTAGNNVARFDYDPLTRLPRGLLIEEARANILTNSQVINSWPTKTDITVVDNNTTSPDGTVNAARITEGVVGNAFATSNAAAVAGGATVTGSVFVKRGTTDWFKLIVADTVGAANGVNVWINTATGTIGTVSLRGTATSVSGSVQSVGNGWYRVVGSCTLPAGSTAAMVLCASAAGDNNATRVNNAQYYLWGGQVEQATFPTSYIPTTSAAVTRAADVATVPVGAWFNQNAFTAVEDIAPGALITTTNARALQINDGTASNPIDFYANAPGSVQIRACSSFLSPPFTYSTLGVIRIGLALTRGGTATGVFNGGAPQTATPATVPAAFANVCIGSQLGGSGQWNGYTRRVRYWNRALSNTELQQVTT